MTSFGIVSGFARCVKKSWAVLLNLGKTIQKFMKNSVVDVAVSTSKGQKCFLCARIVA